MTTVRMGGCGAVRPVNACDDAEARCPRGSHLKRACLTASESAIKAGQESALVLTPPTSTFDHPLSAPLKATRKMAFNKLAILAFVVGTSARTFTVSVTVSIAQI